jgi:hypothetical protein
MKYSNFLSTLLGLSMMFTFSCGKGPGSENKGSVDTSVKEKSAPSKEDLQKEIDAKVAAMDEARAKIEEEQKLKKQEEAKKEKELHEKAMAALQANNIINQEMSTGVELDHNIEIGANNDKALDLISKGETVPNDLLREAFLDVHFSEELKDHISRRQLNTFRIKAKANLVKYLDRPGHFKDQLERLIMKEFNLDDIVYNKDKSNLLDVFSGSQQCHSGTSLFEFFYADVAASIKEKNDNANKIFRVTIFEEGHVLPGEYKLEEGEWKLYGIETTIVGKKKTLKDPKGDKEMRVILSRDFLLAEVIGNHLSDRAREHFIETAQKKMVAMFKFPLSEMEEKIKTNITDLNPDLVHSGIFSFGVANVAAGNISRGSYVSFEPIYSSKNVYKNETIRVNNPFFNFFAKKYGVANLMEQGSHVDLPTEGISFTNYGHSEMVYFSVSNKSVIKKYKNNPGVHYDPGYPNQLSVYSVITKETGRKVVSYTKKIEHPLFKAIREGDQSTVSKFLKEGISSNSYDRVSQYRLTALEVAIKNKQWDITDILLNAGADVYHDTPYMGGHPVSILGQAVDDDDSELIKILLKQGVNPNKKMVTRSRWSNGEGEGLSLNLYLYIGLFGKTELFPLIKRNTLYRVLSTR